MVFYQRRTQMKIVRWLLFFETTIALGKPVYYGDHLVHTELRSTNHSLLLFPAPVISDSCQPAVVEFDSLTEETINIYEMNQVQAKTLEEQKQEDNGLIKRLLRIKPSQKD